MYKFNDIPKEIIENVYGKYKTQLDVILKNVPFDEREKEKVRIIKDLIFVTTNSDFSPSEYFMYDFAHKNYDEQCTFFADKSTVELFYRLNDKTSIPYNTRDKWKVYQDLKSYYNRDICLVVGYEQKDKFNKMLREKHRLFLKPLCGTCGYKTQIIEDENANEETFQKLLLYYAPDGFLAEEMIKQSDFMNKFNPTSINTLRIMTIRMDNRICMYFEFRIGLMFSIVDNLDYGSLICGIDGNDGTIISAFNKNRTPYLIHPHTKTKIVDAKLFKFSEAVELAKDLSKYYNGFRYLSWDFALTDEGWVIVELNGKGGLCGFQLVYNKGIRKDVETYLAELNQPIDFKGLLNEKYDSLLHKEMCPHVEYPFSL